MEQGILTHYLGWAAWILLLIPTVIFVRIVSKRSRWSVLRISLVAVLGVAALAAWLHYVEPVFGTGPGTAAGRLGEFLSRKLDGWTGKAGLSFLVSTVALFLWTIAAIMDAVIATARFFINKPYVREVVKEVRKIVPVEQPVRKEVRAGGRPSRMTKDKPAPSGKGGTTKGVKKDSGAVDEVPDYKVPTTTLLKDGSSGHHEVTRSEINRNISIIRETLSDHHVQVDDIEAIPGPTVTLYKVHPAKGVRVAAIRSLTDDVSGALKAGKVMSSILEDCVGLEVANRERSAVSMKELAESREFLESDAALPVVIGRKVTGEVKVFDLADAPHLLVAGATGQGKSVALNVLTASLLLAKRPSELKMVFIDPKKTEFGRYSRLCSHYLAITPGADSEEDEKARAIIKSPKAADETLRSLCLEMDERYDLLEKAGTPEVREYNRKYLAHELNPNNGHRFLPYIVTIIDEYAQLVLGTGSPDAKAHARSIMTSIISLAQMGRACGIHLVIATQTPRHEVISGLIKANFPMSIGLKTKTDVDSRVILDEVGAEKLLGRGDMLISKNATMERIQCGYISSAEIDAITRAVESQKGYRKSFNTPYYLPEVKDESEGSGTGVVDMNGLDSKFEEAARLVVLSQRGSTSDIQRRLSMGYAKAGRIMDQLEAAGVVGPQNGSKKREVLVGSIDGLETILKEWRK